MGDRLANEIQLCQMTLNEGDLASPDKQIQFNYTLHQQRLDQVQSSKYLGITITDNLDWVQHISEISAKATKTMGFLRRYLTSQSQNSDCTGGEGAEDSCQVDLQEMEKHE